MGKCIHRNPEFLTAQIPRQAKTFLPYLLKTKRFPLKLASNPLTNRYEIIQNDER
jgi:hypothetical protein